MNSKAGLGGIMEMSIRLAKLVVPTTCALFVLAGCETPPSALEEDFGSSVRNTIALQTAQPGQETPALDGVKADASFRAYQKEVAQPEASRQLININVGN